MRDYIFRQNDGQEVPVARMDTRDINECLAGDLCVEGNVELRAAVERLQLELDIRRWGLRT